MTKQIEFSILFLLGVVVPAMGQVKEHFPAKLKSVSAKLYYSATGTFSENIIDNQNFALSNVIIGEGSAASPSTETFIEIETVGDGAPNVYGSDTLTVTTRAEGKLATTRKFDHLNFSHGGRHFEGIWLYDTGCLPIIITVRVNTQIPVVKKIDFYCAE